MSEQNIFAVATRNKLRFDTPKGQLTVEDLWDLKLDTGVVNLNLVAQIVYRELKATDEVNFVDTKPAANASLELKMDIVKHIIAYRIEARDRAAQAAETRHNNQVVTDIIARKKMAELEGKSIEELQQLIK